MYIVAPNKETSLRQFLPDNIVYQQSGLTPINQVLTACEDCKTFLYYNSEILAQDDTSAATYDKGSSQWNAQGALKYLMAALDALGEADLKRRLEAVPFVYGNNRSAGDLGASVGRPPEATETFKFLTPYTQIAFENEISGEGHIRHTYSRHGSGRGVVFHDSYVAPLMPLISEAFEQVLFVQTPDYIPGLVSAFEPQYVLRLQVERLFIRRPSRFDDTLQWIKEVEARRGAAETSGAYIEKLLAKGPLDIPPRPARQKVLFCHIPKNAGTSIAAHLVSQFSWPEIFGLDGQKLLLEHLVAHRKGVVETHNFVSGHIPLSSIEDVLDRFDLIIAIVRPPMERLISHHQYFVQEGQVKSDTSLKEFFDTIYVGNPLTRNAQCGFLGRENRFLSVKERLASTPSLRIVPYHALERLNVVAEEFGLKPFHIPRLNVTRVKSDPWTSVTPALYAKVFDWFSEDFLLYDYVMGKKN